MELIRRIHKKAILIIIPLALLSAFIEGRTLPAGILIGGILGFLNVKGLAWGVGGLIGSNKASAKMIIFSMFRFLILVIILGSLIYFRVVNVFGLLAGFTVIFVLVIIEGLRFAKEPGNSAGG